MFSILIEVLSPVITQRASYILDYYIEELDDDQVGTDAQREIRAFSEYAFDMFQAYTASVLTLISGVVQAISTDGSELFNIVLLLGVFVVVAALLYDKAYIGDPMMYQSFTKKWFLSPVSLMIISLNIVIIVIILT